MKEKILDHEIEEILRDNTRKLTPLSEIESKLENNRKKKNKTSVSKTTVYTKLEKMVDQKKILHINRKGYKLLRYDFTESDPNFKYFKIYRNIIDVMGFIWVTKGGKLDEGPELMDNFKGDLDEIEWNDFKNNYKKLIEQGILEIKQYHKKFSPFLSVSYLWALYHNLCPICLKKINLNEPHFVLEFVEEEAAYIEFTKTHICCIEGILNRYELKKEYEGESSTYDPYDEFTFEEISERGVHFTCPSCGLTLDLHELFLDEEGPLKNIYKKFYLKNNDNPILGYIQNLCNELYGDVSTLTWARDIRFKKVRLVIKKVVMLEGIAYHPNCALNKQESDEKWKRFSNKTEQEVRI